MDTSTPIAWEALRKRRQKDCKSQDTRKYAVKVSHINGYINKMGTMAISMENTNKGKWKSCRVISLDKQLITAPQMVVKYSVVGPETTCIHTHTKNGLSRLYLYIHAYIYIHTHIYVAIIIWK